MIWARSRFQEFCRGSANGAEGISFGKKRKKKGAKRGSDRFQVDRFTTNPVRALSYSGKSGKLDEKPGCIFRAGCSLACSVRLRSGMSEVFSSPATGLWSRGDVEHAGHHWRWLFFECQMDELLGQLAHTQ